MITPPNPLQNNVYKGHILDECLALGYYRMGHAIFTTNYIQTPGSTNVLAVYWLRTKIKNITESRHALKIRKKTSSLKVAYKRATITKEIEDLYSHYYSKLDFETAQTCNLCLHDNVSQNPFDSWMIEIRDNSVLIAVGYFDLGKTAIAGILNFYDPDYSKYSLGKYLMLKKIDYAVLNKLDYYYTGYLCPQNPKFNYKLFPDIASIEYYDSHNQVWLPYPLS